MSGKSELWRLKERVAAKRTSWLVWAESLLILGLLSWVSQEYQNNAYLQGWLARYIGPLGFLFNGTLAGLYAGGLIGHIITVYAGKKTEEERILERIKEQPDLGRN